MVTCEEKRGGWERGGVFIGEKDPGLGPSGHITLNAQTWTQDVQQRTMSSFRFQARYALLTYAQCGNLDPFAVVNHLAELGAECIIGKRYDYAIKDGDVVAGGLERPAGSGLASNGDVWPEIINAKDESEFWSLCESLAPRALVTQFTQLRAFAAWKFPPIRVPYETPEGIIIDTSWVVELDQWVRHNLVSSQTGSKLSCTSP